MHIHTNVVRMYNFIDDVIITSYLLSFLLLTLSLRRIFPLSLSMEGSTTPGSSWRGGGGGGGGGCEISITCIIDGITWECWYTKFRNITKSGNFFHCVLFLAIIALSYCVV